MRGQVRSFAYPPTPDIATAVQRRLAARSTAFGVAFPPLARIALVILLLVAALIAVPSVRAGLLDWLQIGSIRLRTIETPESIPTETSRAEAPPHSGEADRSESATGIPTITDDASSRPLTTYDGLAITLEGETTLEQAASEVAFPVRLPTYPESLGLPDRVLVHTLQQEQHLVLLWLVPGSESEVRMILHALNHSFWAEKFIQGQVITQTTVDGRQAAWVPGPHLLEIYSWEGEAAPSEQRLVEGNVLIWTIGDLTYRLETGLSLAESRRIAESLQLQGD